MSIEIVASSPKAQEIAQREEETKSSYPFEKLEIGQSFRAKIDEINWKSLRVMVSQKNKQQTLKDRPGKRFVFIKHDDLGLVEVARIA